MRIYLETSIPNFSFLFSYRTRPSRNAEELLAALHSKALGGNYRVAIISGDSGLSPLQVLNVVEASKLGPVLHTHMATGPASAATALLSLRDSSGVPFSEILLFARDRQLIEAALSAGIVCCKVTGKDIDADVLGSGLDLFGKRQLDEKGF